MESNNPYANEILELGLLNSEVNEVDSGNKSLNII